MKSTNYYNTFIAVIPENKCDKSKIPPERNTPTIARLTYELVSANPYRYTSDEILWEIYKLRNPKAQKEAFNKINQACLRCSPLPKTYGWGFHCDEDSKVALYAIDSREYQEILDNGEMKIVRAFGRL